MKFTVDAKHLARVLKNVKRAMDARTKHPMLCNCIITTHTYDNGGSYIQIGAFSDKTTDYFQSNIDAYNVENGIGIVAPVKRLLEIVSKMSGEITFNSKNITETAAGKLSIEHQHGKTSLDTLPTADFPTPPLRTKEKANFILSYKAFIELYDKTAYGTSKDVARIALAGVKIEFASGKFDAVATDGHRMVMATNVKPIEGNGKIEAIIPLNAYKKLYALAKAIKPEELKFEYYNDDAIGQHMVVRFVSKYFESFSIKLIGEAFPNWKDVIPKDNRSHWTIETEALKAALESVIPAADPFTHMVKLDIVKGNMALSTHDYDLALTANSSVEIKNCELYKEYSYAEIDNLKIGFNSIYLMEILKQTRFADITFSISEALRACLLTGTPDDDYSAFTNSVILMQLYWPDDDS